MLELTHNWDQNQYELGEGYGHIALGVEDIQSTCLAISKRGGRVVRDPGPMQHGNTVIAFVEEPDGYKVELIQLASREAASCTLCILRPAKRLPPREVSQVILIDSVMPLGICCLSVRMSPAVGDMVSWMWST